MAYVSAIAVDFGSTNSGCCRVCEHDENGELIYANPEFLHSVGDYAKDNTWFYVEESFLERIRKSYSSLRDDEFHIVSKIFPNTPNPNIIWGREAIKHNMGLIKSGNWKCFKRFKMMLYRGDESYIGLDFPLILIIKTYLRIIKLECLALESQRLCRNVAADEIMWGLTIPTIWTDSNKRVMSEIAHEVFTEQTRVLSEPEGPLVYSLQAANAQSKLEYVDGRVSLVIDMGGGTTDICLMKETRQQGGGYKLEMVSNSDGSAAGGNDIDEAFFAYLLRDISRGLTSDNGIAYDSLNDYDLAEALLSGFQENIDSWIEMEDNWYKLKNRPDFNSITECSFAFTAAYRKWLINNGHSNVAARVGEYLMDGCSFRTADLVDKVFSPTFDKICSKIREIISNVPDGITINRVVLAGGLSCNYQLNALVRNTLSATLGASIADSISSMGALMAGGAIAAGACYMLLNKDAITRLSAWNRTYFYDSRVKDVTPALIDEYRQFDVPLKPGHISGLMDDEEKYDTTIFNIGTLVLFPVAIKGKLVRNFVADDLSTREGQTSLSIRFYSSEKPIVIYANQDNPDLRMEKEIRIPCQPDTGYQLEVDFNEATISNSLHYVLKVRQTGDVVAEGSIDDAFTNKEE